MQKKKAHGRVAEASSRQKEPLVTDICLICFYSTDHEGLFTCLRQFIQVLTVLLVADYFLIFICQILPHIYEDDNILKQCCKALAHCGQ